MGETERKVREELSGKLTLEKQKRALILLAQAIDRLKPESKGQSPA